MAVIVLKSADFSRNNIGTINLFKEFSQTTLGVFTRFGITPDEENVMQIKVDEFIRSLVLAGIWGNGKIDRLCLPFLAELSNSNTLDNAVKNCIDDGLFFESDTYSNLQLTEHGIKPLKNGGTTAQVNLPDSYQLGKFHLGAYPITNDVAKISTGVVIYKNIIFAKKNVVGFINTSNTATIGMYVAPGNIVPYDKNYSGVPRMIIGTMNTDIGNGYPELYTAGQRTEGSSNATYSPPTLLFGWNDNNYLDGEETMPSSGEFYMTSSSYCILSCGGYLTQTEADAYTQATNRLVTAIHTYMD